jgi:HD superfamily phosphohydrolase
MNNKRKFRYDPLYRVIDEPQELRIIEGNFRKLFDRLKQINNLGIIPEVFEMAKYPKYEHKLGTIHQVNSLLSVAPEDLIPEKYRTPLKIASIFLHLGHLPFAHPTERALLLASNLGDRNKENKIKRYINKRLEKVLEKAGFEDKRTQNVLEDIFSLREYRELYKYFSAYYLIEKWNRINQNIEDLDDDNLQIIICNLIDKKSPGYEYLTLADKADYVQRDALYFGTIKLDVPPKHLYSKLAEHNPTQTVNEKILIEYNLKYLSEKFYNNLDVVWFSRLFEKILASLMMSKNFDLEWLEIGTDEELKRLMCDNFDPGNNRTQLPVTWVRRGKKLFSGEVEFSKVFELKGVNYPKEKDIIDFEYEIIRKPQTIRGLLTYPYNKGILLSIEYDNQDVSYRLPDQDLFTVTLFQDSCNRKFIELLNTVKNIETYLSVMRHSKIIRRGLGCEISWTHKVRFANEEIVREISEAIKSLGEDFIIKYLSSLSRISTYSQIWDNFDNRYLWKTRVSDSLRDSSIDEKTKDKVRQFFVYGLLGLPIRLLQYKTTRIHLKQILDELENKMSAELPSGKKGNIFEAICLITRILNKRGRYQYFLNSLVVRDPEKPRGQRDDNEFDVVELLVDENNRAACHIYACSIADDYVDKNKDPITTLTDHIHSVYPNLIIRTFYVIPENKNANNWSPFLEETGRSYN